MEINKKNLYNAPKMEIVELIVEGVLCYSGDNEGIFDGEERD